MVQIFRSESGFGFSLVGSAEIGSYIADIKPGGPADGVAYRGDQILMIDDLKIGECAIEKSCSEECSHVINQLDEYLQIIVHTGHYL